VKAGEGRRDVLASIDDLVSRWRERQRSE